MEASTVKPGVLNVFFSYCFLILSSKRRFLNPSFQNWGSNPNWYGKHPKNPKPKKAISWFNLTWPLWGVKIQLCEGKNYLGHSFDLTTLRLSCSETIFLSCVRMHFVWKFRIFSSLKTCEVQSSMQKQITYF